jgi:hypothetical protein
VYLTVFLFPDTHFSVESDRKLNALVVFLGERDNPFNEVIDAVCTFVRLCTSINYHILVICNKKKALQLSVPTRDHGYLKYKMSLPLWYSSLARQCCCPGLRTRDFLERIATAEMSAELRVHIHVVGHEWSNVHNWARNLFVQGCVLFRQSNLFVRCWNGVLSVRSPRFDVRSACPTRQAAKVYNIVIGQKNRCSPVLMKTGKTGWFFCTK